MTPHVSSIGTLARNLVAYGASEAAAKLSRLFVVVAVAHRLDPVQIGIAATALAAADILKALTENGVIQRIILAPADRLAATCLTAHRIFWAWCGGLFVLQSLVALGVWLSGADPLVAALILMLAGEYLFMPGGLIQAGLAMRQGKLRQTAAIAGAQIVLSNILAVVIALVWPSALALILPRLLTAPLWLVLMRRLAPWRPEPGVTPAPIGPFLRYGWAVLGVELVKAMRLQADKLVVGALLGAQMLGIYFMAFNAGLSIASSFSTAFATVLFPHLCGADDRATALRQSILMSLGLVTPIVLAQSLLAPIYVPMLLGHAWAQHAPVVSVLCLAAIPAMLWTAAAGWLRAADQPHKEFLVTLALTALLILNTVLLAPRGLLAIATGYTIVTWTVLCAASVPALIHAFGPRLTARV
ncbi:PST family polysaccharide transporter [Albidovulum inexpectatum]|uniref:PST family polysaccharide transporter n=1 Tax=Albidovulum inexpectatum TaxID=196587 RepID=A0A2S5JH67_9RHOB|nr:oligosaccharide flippase family protein [Albidovulum inexpectatum]PPB80708.1 PST family polysaccharide transporter [Albidovulum inexpectatum]